MPRGDLAFLRGLAAASEPVDELTITEHAELFRKVSEESGSPWPGDFRISRVPYLREPEDCLHPDHPARRVTARWAAQLGKSTAIENWFCYVVDKAPGSFMIVLPTLEEALKFNRVKLQPTIDASPKIKHRVMAARDRSEQGSTTAYKRFAGGFCLIVNAASSKGLQMVSIKYLAMDESTGYPRDVDGRGSPRDQARARQKMYGDLAKEWQGSTPGIAGECAITEDFEAGDQRYHYVRCPHCRWYQRLLFDNMKGPDLEKGRPARFHCLSCNGEINDSHKAGLLASGEWIAHRMPTPQDEPPPDVFPASDLSRWKCLPKQGRCAAFEPSYDLWAAYAPKEKFGEIWSRWESAQGDTTKLRTFYQQDLAKPYDPGGAAIAWETIVDAARKNAYPRGVVPRWAGVLVAAADVQGYGIKWAVYAIGPRGQRYLIDREIFEGAPDQTDEPWIKLADALGRTYPTASGQERPIDLAGVDSGFATNRVYRFCAARPNVYALDGRHQQGLPWLGTPSKRDIKDQHGRIIAKVLLYPVGLYDAKTEVVAGLANFVAGTADLGRWPRNTLHLTGELCDETFAQEITAERLVDPDAEILAASKRSRKMIVSKRGREWKKIVGRANDWFDVTVYAVALGYHLEHKRRLTPARWEELLMEIHGEPESPDLFAKAPSPFDAASKPKDISAERQARRDKWANRNR